MSWKANMNNEFTYFPKPYPLGPGKSKTATTVKSKSNIKKANKTPVKNQPRPSDVPATTMTGLPWKARAKLEGKLKPEPPRRRSPPARLANYTFTYGLSKEDENLVRSEIPSRLGLSVTSFRLSPGAETSQLSKTDVRAAQTAPPPTSTSGLISEKLKAIKDSFHQAEVTSTAPNAPKPYFRNWGNAKSDVIAGQGLDLDDSEMILHSTRNILEKTGIHDGLDSYFEGLGKMDQYDIEEDTLPLIEPQKAAAAFQAPVPKPSRLQPKTYYEVGKSKNVSRQSLYQSKSKVSAVDSTPTASKKSSSKKVRMAEPDPTIFIQSPKLKPSHQEKIVQKQLQREISKTPMTHEQYTKRKEELLRAALQAYDRDVPTYEAIPDIRDEVIAAEEHSVALSRQNIMDLLYNALTNQSKTLSMKSPSTSLHLSSSNFTRGRPETKTRSRPLDHFQGAVVSTILREMQEQKGPGVVQSQEFTPTVTHNPRRAAGRHVPTRKESKEKVKALRALENYDLSKLRQRNALAPKPVLTLLSVKKGQGQGHSHITGVGGTSSANKPRALSHQSRNIDQTPTTSGLGSFTALSSLQTRNEKYNLGRRMRPVRTLARNRDPQPLVFGLNREKRQK